MTQLKTLFIAIFAVGITAVFVLAQTSLTPPKVEGTGSGFSAKQVEEFVGYHNKVRKDVKVDGVKWSPEIAKYAQEWADHLAANGEFEHRPSEGKWAQKYGENIAINATILKGAEAWYEEIKDYKAGTAIPEDFTDFKAGHYTQMVWKKTKLIGAGTAIMQKGDYKGLVLIVCNYDPPGNFVGEKPY